MEAATWPHIKSIQSSLTALMLHCTWRRGEFFEIFIQSDVMSMGMVHGAIVKVKGGNTVNSHVCYIQQYACNQHETWLNVCEFQTFETQMICTLCCTHSACGKYILWSWSDVRGSQVCYAVYPVTLQWLHAAPSIAQHCSHQSSPE